MYINTAIAEASASLIRATKDDNESPVAKWSSLIGIITAICGNILISFALNTQRYAHMRLGDAQDREQEKNRAERKKRRKSLKNYGTTNDNVAEERSRKNADAQFDGSTDVENGDAEREALIPKVGSRKSSSSTSDTYVEDEKEDGESSGKSYLKSPIWWLGISMMVVGEAGNFLAYGFAPASIVSPLGVVALISNCLIAPLLLHEQFRIRDGVGVIIAIAGCVTVVLSASGSNPKLSPDDIWYLITQWEFETYLGITVFLIIVLMVASNKFGDRTVLIDLGLVGLFGGYTALSTKGVASLLSNTIWRAFTFPISYLLIVILVATAVLQIKYVNRALQRFNSTIVIPTQFVLFTISVIVGSAVLYRDFERQSAADAGKFVGGCALTFLGVWCITSGRDNDDHDDDDEEEDEEVQMVDHESANGRDVDADRKLLSARRPVQRAHTAEDLPIVITPDPDSSSQGKYETLQATQTPANRSAVHPSSSAEISSGTGSSKPPALHATTSEPMIPRIDTSALQPESASRRRPSEGQGTSPLIQPDQTQAHRLLGRHSITDLLPGPLMSPLSSSLSAIVADSLRRGIDHTPTSTLRGTALRGRSFRVVRRKTGESVKGNEDTARRRSIDSADLDPGLSSERTQRSDAERPGGAKRRGRSFSATISDIFASPKKQKNNDNDSPR